MPTATSDNPTNTAEDDPLTAALRARAVGTNVNPQTLLATDYLNHFNEVVMLLEMVPDMPELVEELRAWAPKTYVDHFRDSTVADRDLAVEAYDHAPARFREPFERTVVQMNKVMAATIRHLDALTADGATDSMKAEALEASRLLQRLMDHARGRSKCSSIAAPTGPRRD